MLAFVGQPFQPVKERLHQLLLEQSHQVEAAPHSMKDAPSDWAITHELQNVSIELSMRNNDMRSWQRLTRPNLPWAEDHFQERVGGEPLNPAPSEEYWPYAVKQNTEHKNMLDQFSHTYPERMWPKRAGIVYSSGDGDATMSVHFDDRMGIRYHYGDLNDVVEQLRRDRNTRQAYLPIWFPEDTGMGARKGERVPCSLGYHFIIRRNAMSCTYYLRSCDFRRYFTDDIYMAGRLLQWVADEVDPHLGIDKLLVHITSLHVFQGDIPMMSAEQTQERV